MTPEQEAEIIADHMDFERRCAWRKLSRSQHVHRHPILVFAPFSKFSDAIRWLQAELPRCYVDWSGEKSRGAQFRLAYGNYDEPVPYYFSKASDAMRFKLTFGGS